MVAHTLLKLDTGTSAQAHKGLLIKAYNASSTLNAIEIDHSTTGTGRSIYMYADSENCSINVGNALNSSTSSN